MLPTYESSSSDAAQTGTQVVRRTVLLLRAVAAKNRTGARLTDICHEVGIGMPTAHRILQALVGEGLLKQHAASKKYYLGNQIYEMGLAAAPSMDIRDVCHPHLQRIANMTGDAVFLTGRAGFDAVCLDRVEGDFPIRIFLMQAGLRRPLGVGGGAVCILSCLPDVEIDRILAANSGRALERSPRYSEEHVRRLIVHARANGWLLSEVVELPAVWTFAMPIRNPDGTPAGAISTSALKSRLEGGLLERVKSAFAEVVRDIEFSLGGVVKGKVASPLLPE